MGSQYTECAFLVGTSNSRKVSMLSQQVDQDY